MTKKTRTTEEWQAIIAEQEASGQEQAKWCKEHDINLYTYRDRASRLRKTARIQETLSGSWVKIEPEDETDCASENVKTPISGQLDNGGRHIETNADSSQMAGVLVIEAGAVKLYASAAYPAVKLKELLGELVRPC